ncbi:hypothetical protein SIAM614_25152 [Roseibium aggregatum IAM 12614]|uniref:ABM domain-containing protein n=1 Tax=Roseibium aggregatum (strain ATCC 25650 / DSM 13394 / JCM 20685 / NBRC 16684 / NCIMB 2208 / IAM 12614 / B1) TaxID=384765 RepID=A0NYW7_ROSAI|nr:antibiotic biosynthesis monooxygenase [Roseibium aggregatum]EAV41968.1 hypothetical protein SIAM614_25152 [Roseibium aggregatum IAM 12614]
MTSLWTRRAVHLAALCLLTANLGVSAMANEITSKAPVTLINSFEVPQDRLADAIRGWEKARDFLKQQPGYVTTRLHQSLSPQAKFQLVNVALWESPDAYQTAIQKLGKSGIVAEFKGIDFHAALYTVIREDE